VKPNIVLVAQLAGEDDMKILGSEKHSTLGEAFRPQRLPWLRVSLGVVVGLVAVMRFAFPETVFARAADAKPAIRILVDNYSQTSRATLARAEREAGRILGEAGVIVVWLDCPLEHSAVIHGDPCLHPLEPADIVLRVLSDRTRNGFRDSAFGFAVLPFLASVYYEHAVRLAKTDDAEFEVPIILGYVMVHELGHLLLGSNSHSDTGIMQSQWERKQVRQLMMGTLHFTSQQSKHIRAEVRTRMSPQSTQLRMPN